MVISISEKLIPLIINNIYNELPLPVYGKGNVRDWLYVEDHASAIFEIINGKIGNTYCIGGEMKLKI